MVRPTRQRAGPEDVLATVRHNQMEYFYGDVLLRGKIPGYALRYFKDNGWKIRISPAEEEKLRHHCDFFSFSYYYTRLCDQAHFEQGNEVFRNRSFPLTHGAGQWIRWACARF